MSSITDKSYNRPSFTLGNRVARAFWGVTYLLLFRPSPRPFHAWRSFLLRCFGAKIGHGVHVYPRVEIWAPWNLEVDDYVGVGNKVIIYNQARITIGTYSVISQGAHLCSGTHDYTKKGFPLITNPITVGARVWIAAEAFIHPGVVLGEGCVVGARSVVTRSLPPWKVCSGFPAVPLKDRVLGD